MGSEDNDFIVKTNILIKNQYKWTESLKSEQAG